MSDAVLDFGIGFKSVGERLDGERDERLERRTRIMPFGVSFLDDALAGIFPNDLIVIGAKTGIGKTALATAIAHHNVKSGKRVHYFALEAEEREIERRMKYRALMDLVYAEGSQVPRDVRQRMNYIDWYAGKLDGATGELVEKAIDRKVAEEFKTLNTYYRIGGNFGIEDLSRLFLAIQDQTDLIILDHLHYVDIEDDNENRGVKDVVKRIRDIALGLGKPVIVVAHLRKSDRRNASLLPDLDDFHGTSDITKIATKCIMMAPARDQSAPRPHLWPTYMHAPKCRTEGGRTRYAGLLLFNSRMQSYEERYQLGKMAPSGAEFEPTIVTDLPGWANGASQ